MTTSPTAIRIQLLAPTLVAWGLERLVETAVPRLQLVHSAPGLAQALAQLAAGPAPDVVVVDLDMDEPPQAVATLRAHTPARLLVITASANPEQHDRAVLDGASGVVAKKESPATLLKAIERVHEGEMWVDRSATSRLLQALSQRADPTPAPPEQALIDSLTRRERQTIRALVENASATGKQLAERLNISEHTLRNHLTSIYQKLGLTNRVDLYAFAHRHQLHGPDGPP